MEFHLGRLIDHVHLRVRDLEASKRFYRAVLHALGLPIGREGDGWFSADELFIDEGDPPTARLHLAFQAPDRETVHRFHAAALAAGGRDNGAPGERGMMVTPLPPSQCQAFRAHAQPAVREWVVEQIGEDWPDRLDAEGEARKLVGPLRASGPRLRCPVTPPGHQACGFPPRGEGGRWARA